MATQTLLTREQMLAEMDQALDEEIAHNSKNRNIRHSAVDGKLLSEGNGQYIYQFTLLEPWTPNDDAPLAIANEEARGFKCSVVNSTGTLLTIASDKPFSPSLLRQIDLSDDATELLKRQKEALKQADEGTGQLASKSFGLIPYQQQLAPSDERFGCSRLREAQHVAAQMSLGGEVAFVIGPPGTGKTMSLAAIAYQHLQARRTVLIAAHTNIAIDNAMMKLCEMCKEAHRSDLLVGGMVVRYGAVQKAELKDDPQYAEIYLPKVAQALGGVALERQKAAKDELESVMLRLASIEQEQKARTLALEQRQSEVNADLAHCKQELVPLEQEEQRYIANLREQEKQQTTHMQQKERERTQAGQQLARVKARREELKRELASCEQQEQQATSRLVEARAMNGLKRLFKGIKVEALEEQVATWSQKAYMTEQALNSVGQDIERLAPLFNKYSQEYEQARQELLGIRDKLNMPTERARRIEALRERQAWCERQLAEVGAALKHERERSAVEMRSLKEQEAKLEEELAVIDLQLRDVEKSIVSKALIVGTTLTKTYMNQAIVGRRFDAVILDEVSMAPMPLVYLAASRAERSVTLIGDPQQLAPIFSAEKSDMAKKWLGQDLFNLRGVSLQAAQQRSQHSVLLNVQSRMHPAIARVANKLVYGGLLQDAFDLSRLKQIAPFPAVPLVLCDTQDASPIATRPPNNKSWKNYYHALCCISLARKVLDEHPELKKQEPTIGIVTPYRPQAQLLQSLVKDAGLHIYVQADTVHRYQGLEFDVIIFDTVESTGSYASDFIAGSNGSTAMRLLNVAVTRARQKLIIVANQRFIRQRFPAASIVRQGVLLAAESAVVPSLDVVGTPFSTLIAQAQSKRPGTNDPASLLTQLDLAQEELLTLAPVPEEQHFTEETFYEAFKRDMRRARASILIASPFLATDRVNNLLPSMLEQQQRGIRITVYTRPLEESEEWHVKGANTLLQAGIPLIYCPQMHQKAIIIDEAILYHGSLNALSHRDTHESMLRIITPRIVQGVRESLVESKPTKSKRIITLTETEEKSLKAVYVPVKSLPPIMKTCTCGGALVARARNDRTGAFYGCQNYGRGCNANRSENLTEELLQQVDVLQKQKCGKCGRSLEPELVGKPLRAFLICSHGCGERQKVMFTK